MGQGNKKGAATGVFWMNILMLGPPGVGKGTVSNKLSKKLGYPHISTGDMLRENVSNKSDLGMKAKQFMDKGLLVPDEVVIGMVQERLKRGDAKKGYLLDGFPRTIVQADALDKVTKIDTVINLAAKDNIIVERLSRRRVCRKCGFIYHLDFIKPKKEGECDTCHGELYQRDDDKPEAIRKRLHVYHEQTKPLVDYYAKKGLLINVDGSGLPEGVFELVEKAIEIQQAKN